MWVGNDDSTPMRGSTGGGVVAPAWRTFMTYALKKVPATEIAALPGLPLHPAQIAEIERLRASRPAEVADTEKKTPSGVMPEASRKALRALAEDLRSAAGIVPEKTGSLEDGGIAKRIGAARRVSSTGGAPL
ncbi:MAG: hypothetical protein R3D33_15420 [Hyphomicrobiaceae bacterium]